MNLGIKSRASNWCHVFYAVRARHVNTALDLLPKCSLYFQDFADDAYFCGFL